MDTGDMDLMMAGEKTPWSCPNAYRMPALIHGYESKASAVAIVAVAIFAAFCPRLCFIQGL